MIYNFEKLMGDGLLYPNLASLKAKMKNQTDKIINDKPRFHNIIKKSANGQSN